ncbi:MAG: hypothetical protein Q9160_007471 [Pyrenula sp. 1 TL-2023]
MASSSKNLPAEPEEPPSPPPKEPPKVPPKDNTCGKPVNKYAIRLGSNGEEPDAAEVAESDFSDTEESYGLLQGKEKRRPSWKWLHRSRSWIIAITISFLLACLTIKLFRHRSNSGENGGSKNGSPFRAAKTAPPPSPREYALNFPEQYPPLAADTNEECKAVWGKLTSVPCHSRVWSRNWDAGKLQPLGPSLARFLPLICKETCATELRNIAEEVGHHCWTARWDLEGYNGRFTTKLLEESPADATRVLRNRFTHNCHESPSGDAEMGYCMTDLEERWWIWDGMNANHMANLGSFLRFTNERKTEPKRKISGVRGGKDWRQPYNYWRDERQFGPKKGETSCSFCTMNWFIRMLEAWNEKTVDENGELIDLPHYLARIYQAGRRCTNTAPGASFQVMYNMQVENYKQRDLLDNDWEGSAASREILLPGKAPTVIDQPLPAIQASLKKLEGQKDGMTKIHRTYADLLSNLYDAAQNLTCNVLIAFDDLREYLDHGLDISPLCSQSCQYSSRDISKVLHKVSPQRMTMYDRYADKHALYNIAPLKTDSDLIQQACHTEKSRFHHIQPCSVVFHRFGKLNWIRKPHDDPKDVALTVRKAVRSLPEMLSDLAELVRKPESEPSAEERTRLRDWTLPLRNGACSLCFWRQFVQESWFADEEPRTRVPGIDDRTRVDDETLIMWFRAVKDMFEGCRSVGVELEQREYEAIMKKVPEGMMDEIDMRVWETVGVGDNEESGESLAGEDLEGNRAGGEESNEGMGEEGEVIENEDRKPDDGVNGNQNEDTYRIDLRGT